VTTESSQGQDQILASNLFCTVLFKRNTSPLEGRKGRRIQNQMKSENVSKAVLSADTVSSHRFRYIPCVPIVFNNSHGEFHSNGDIKYCQSNEECASMLSGD
jgi:hypothetical protein